MKEHAPVLKSDTVQRQASAHAGTTVAPDGPRQREQGAHIAQLQAAQPVQLAGGKKHHDPTKKKHLAKGVGKAQKDTSAKALAIKKASPVPISNKEAKRQAKGK
jgi:hypothetical protein